MHVSTLIHGRMGRTEELSDFKHGTVIGCNLCHKTVHKISALLDLPQTTVSAITDKWKRQQLSHKNTQTEVKRIKIDGPLLHHSLQSSKLPLGATSAQERGVRSFMKWVSMAKQLHTSPRSLGAMPSVGWSGVKYTAIGHSNSITASPSSSLTDESGLGECWRMLHAQMHSDNCKN